MRYFETISQELIPKYNTTTSPHADTFQTLKYKPLRQKITGPTRQLNGGLLIFSFQINAEDEIACYLWYQGECVFSSGLELYILLQNICKYI